MKCRVCKQTIDDGLAFFLGTLCNVTSGGNEYMFVDDSGQIAVHIECLDQLAMACENRSRHHCDFLETKVTQTITELPTAVERFNALSDFLD